MLYLYYFLILFWNTSTYYCIGATITPGGRQQKSDRQPHTHRAGSVRVAPMELNSSYTLSEFQQFSVILSKVFRGYSYSPR
jgi:hypothetical protein